MLVSNDNFNIWCESWAETAGQEAKRYNTMCRIVPTEYLPPPPATRGGEGGGGADQENCVEKELGGNTEIYLQVNTDCGSS